MTDRSTQGWGPPQPPSGRGMRRLGVGVAGVLGGWGVAYGFGRLTWLLGGERPLVVAARAVVLLACVVVGPMVAVRRYDLHHKRP
jgi:hypothetical protein